MSRPPRMQGLERRQTRAPAEMTAEQRQEVRAHAEWQATRGTVTQSGGQFAPGWLERRTEITRQQVFIHNVATTLSLEEAEHLLTRRERAKQ